MPNIEMYISFLPHPLLVPTSYPIFHYYNQPPPSPPTRRPLPRNPAVIIVTDQSFRRIHKRKYASRSLQE